MAIERQIFDVLIAGGGPAGASTACALARAGWSAVVLESASGASPRIGETVPPEIRPALQELGLWEKFLAQEHLPSAGNLSAWGGAELLRRCDPFHPYGSGWHLDRRRFDTLLAEAAVAAGADFRPECRVAAADWNAGLWHVTCRSRTGVSLLSARSLVDATGRPAVLVRKLGGQTRVCSRLVARTATLAASPGARPPAPEVLIEAVEDGWWYSAPIPGNRMVVAFFTDAASGGPAGEDLRPRLERTGPTSRRLRGYAVPPDSVLRSAASAVSEPPAAPRFLAVGDAAMAWDPLASQGIVKGLESGLQAAAVLLAERRGRPAALAACRAGQRAEFDRYLKLRAAFYRLETRWPDSPFWRTQTRQAPLLANQGGPRGSRLEN